MTEVHDHTSQGDWLDDGRAQVRWRDELRHTHDMGGTGGPAPRAWERLVEHLIGSHAVPTFQARLITEETCSWRHEEDHKGEAWIAYVPMRDVGRCEPYDPTCSACREYPEIERAWAAECRADWEDACALNAPEPPDPLFVRATEAGMTDEEWFDALHPGGNRPGKTHLDIAAYLRARSDKITHAEAKTIAHGRWRIARQGMLDYLDEDEVDDVERDLEDEIEDIGLEEPGEWAAHDDDDAPYEDLAEPYGHHAEERETAYNPWSAFDPDGTPMTWY
jgi:hypothetical protein